MTKTIGPILLWIVLIAGPAFSQDVACDDQSVAADLPTTAVPSAEQEAQPAVTIQQPAVTTQQPVQPGPIHYSRAYDVRAKIHKYASFTTLPLVVGEFAIGQSLYNSPSDVKDKAHVALGTAIGGLFAVTSVTGVWNLVESRKDPNRGRLLWIHSLLALAADAGLVATATITPRDEGEGGSSSSNRGTHRALALTSLGLATASYVIMLFGDY